MQLSGRRSRERARLRASSPAGGTLSPSAGRPPGSRPSSGTTAAGSIEYAVAVENLDLAVRNTRVLARAATRAVELDPNLPAEVPAAVRLLAKAVRLVEPALEERDSSAAIDTAVEAAALATRALEIDPALAAAHLVGQVRGIAADLLRALGLERSDAVERIRAAR